MNRFSQMLFTLLVVVCVPARADEISFNRDIRPILSANCFACHGFDAKQRKADLRLDVADSALAERDGQVAIKPGDLSKSEMWRRLTADDPDVVMPPPSTKKHLTVEQKATIRKWIEQGAPFQKHWAFETPAKPADPPVKNAMWSKNSIDRFVLARLEKERHAPRPEANRSTLIRRVAFAVTGLPPTPKEVAEFEADSSPLAYEKMVD